MHACMHKIFFLDQNAVILIIKAIVVALLVVAFLVATAMYRMNQLIVYLSATTIMKPRSMIVTCTSLTDVSSTSISVVPGGTDYVQKVSDMINDDGWDFAAICDFVKAYHVLPTWIVVE